MKINTSVIFFLASLLAIGSWGSVNAQEEPSVSDKDIKIVHFEELNYPTFARAAHIEGVVVVRVILDDRGGVVKALAISGKDPLIPDCIANAKKWKFQPNSRKMAVIVYNFTLPTGSCGSVTSLFMVQGTNLVTITGCPAPVEPQ
jgi:Gram-negative bacterial TonB protein C-terminal